MSKLHRSIVNVFISSAATFAELVWKYSTVHVQSTDLAWNESKWSCTSAHLRPFQRKPCGQTRVRGATCVLRGLFLKQYVGFLSFFWNNPILSSCGPKAWLRLFFFIWEWDCTGALVWQTNYQIYGPATPHNILLMVDLTTYSQGRTKSEIMQQTYLSFLWRKKTLGTNQDLRGPTGDVYQILQVFLQIFIS